MTQKWLEIQIRATALDVDLAGQILMDLGCCGVTVAEQKLDTFEAPTDIDTGSGPQTLRAYFADIADPGLLLGTVRAALSEHASATESLVEVLDTHHEIDHEDWANSWQQHFNPFRVGTRLIIRPSWVELDADSAETILTLDPGRAFGTGSHETTALCLEALAELAERPSPPQSVLDVGAGSGILAMAAAALGANRVLACEIDPDACQVAAENIRQNGQESVIETTDHPLEELEGSYDLVFANILANENIRLAPHLVAHMHPGSHLLLSGILNEQEAAVIEAFTHYPLELTEILRKQEWSCLVYRHHG
jgi:ribosomal protein L11 methyltransferase